jgi:hypothetical protein
VKDVHAKLFLADYAQVADGKLTTVGAGWNTTGPGPAQFGVAVMIDWPWSEVGSHHTVKIELIDDDGQLVEFPQPEGPDAPFQWTGTGPLIAAPGVEQGSRIVQTLALNVAGLPLPAGGRFEFRMEIDDEADAEWFAAFSTRRD